MKLNVTNKDSYYYNLKEINRLSLYFLHLLSTFSQSDMSNSAKVFESYAKSKVTNMIHDATRVLLLAVSEQYKIGFD
jgi:hypothetical protein